jgi:MFS family permease
VEVAYAKLSLHAGDTGYGVLVGVWGLGVTIGSIVFARSAGRSLRVLLSAATLAVGLAYLGWSIAPGLVVASAIGLIGGVGNGVQWASLISSVQKLTPQDLQGRMMGAVESIGAIAPAVGFSLGGAVTALSSPRDAFLVAGLGATLSTVAFLRLHIGSPSPARATADGPADARGASAATDPGQDDAPVPDQRPSDQRQDALLEPLTAHARAVAGERARGAKTR